MVLLQLDPGKESRIQFGCHGHPEFDDWRWVSFWYPVRQVVSFKREVYRRVMKEFAPLAMPVPWCRLTRKMGGATARVKEHNQLLTELRRIVESMAEANTLEQALQALVSQTRLAMTVDCCSVYVAEPDMRRYRLAATDGLAESAVGKATLPFEQGIVGLVGQREELINLADAPSHPSFKFPARCGGRGVSLLPRRSHHASAPGGGHSGGAAEREPPVR